MKDGHLLHVVVGKGANIFYVRLQMGKYMVRSTLPGAEISKCLGQEVECTTEAFEFVSIVYICIYIYINIKYNK